MLAELMFDPAENRINCTGTWTVLGLDELLSKWRAQVKKVDGIVDFCGSQLEKLDSAGALLIIEMRIALMERGVVTELVNFSKQQIHLIQLVQENYPCDDPLRAKRVKLPLLASIGKESLHKLKQCDGFIILIGDLSLRFLQSLGQWRRFQWASIASNVDSTGLKALPIVGLLSFLIGVVLAYQMGLQLQTYGANIFIAYLSGMAIFREFGPLMTAIIVAGRTSSSFTAQIGSMKVNEEIDAIDTMGLSTTELLVLPKVLGLLLVFPLLIFWADLFSILGAMVMSKLMLGVGYTEFLARLKDSVGLQHFVVGLSKAPAFAVLIAMVGCFQGFLVKFSADSIGKQTTKSVVQAIFLIIVADAAFSVIYSWMDL